MVTPLCYRTLYTEVSQMNLLINETLSQNQTLYRYVHYVADNRSYIAIFARLLPILTKIAMATSVRPLQSEMSSLDWPTHKNHTTEPKDCQ